MVKIEEWYPILSQGNETNTTEERHTRSLAAGTLHKEEENPRLQFHSVKLKYSALYPYNQYIWI
jgi:hypothetical protein